MEWEGEADITKPRRAKDEGGFLSWPDGFEAEDFQRANDGAIGGSERSSSGVEALVREFSNFAGDAVAGVDLVERALIHCDTVVAPCLIPECFSFGIRCLGKITVKLGTAS
jgi:hypothetical protein